MSKQKVISHFKPIVGSDPNVITLWADSNYTGSTKTYSVGSSEPDFDAIGFGGISCFQMPGKSWVKFYETKGYIMNTNPAPYVTESYMFLYNDWDIPLHIDFVACDPIGVFQSIVEPGDNTGYSFNDRIKSMQSGSYNSGSGQQYFDIHQRGFQEAGWTIGATTYVDYNGSNFNTHFETSDSNFGPEHNDNTSSIAVPWRMSADLYADNDYKGVHLGRYDGEIDDSPATFHLRIFNLSSAHNDSASSITIDNHFLKKSSK